MSEQFPHNLAQTNADLAQTSAETKESEHLLQLEAFSEKLHLKSQWESQVKALNETGVLEILPDCQDIGIVGIDPTDPTKTKEYPIPTYAEIQAMITPEQLQILELKQSQGFIKMLLVPIGIPLEILIDRYKRLIIDKHSKGELLSTDGTKLELDKDNPIFVWDKIKIKNADTDGRLTYFPQDYQNPNFKGFTKNELISGMANNPKHQDYLNQVKPTNAWQVIFIEDNPDLPAENQGKTVNQGQPNQRKQLEANDSSINYLKKIQTNPQYSHEQGLTLEAWLIYAITQLKAKNQQIDDFRGKGKACWFTGSYLSGLVLRGGWDRDDRKAILDRYNSNISFEDYGLRSAVKL